MLTKNVSHNYDPSIVFHSHSSDLPHLNDWINELISLSEKSLPIQANPTTEQLVQALQRYDAMFRELLRQTSIFSEPLTKLLAKVWAGVLKLLDFMIKSYHRYVKHTTHLQEQAQQLLTERQGQMVAAKVREEEFELEKLVLRARIRNLEAEVETLKLSERGKDKEIHRLRTTVTAYMKSQELNDGIWKMMNSDDPIQPHADSDHQDLPDSTFSRKDSIDAGQLQLRNMCRLDVEMDEILANVLKEEDRQRFLIADLMKLMRKNEEVFGALRRVKGNWQSGPIEATRFENRGIQVDEKDVMGAVTDLVLTPREIPDTPAPEVPAVISVVGANVPYQLRKLMGTFPYVLRIPPSAWVCQTIMAIYFDKIRVDEERQLQGLGGIPLAEHMYDYYTRSLGVGSAADTHVAQLLTACEYYMDKLPRVGLFSSQIGLFAKNDPPELDVRDTEYLLQIIKTLMKQGEMLAPDVSITSREGPKPHGSAAEAKGGGHARRMSRQNNHLGHHNDRKGVTTFSIWENLYTTVGSEVTRVSAVRTVQAMLGKWLPDGGQDYIVKVKSMPPTDKAGKMVDIDDLIEILLEPWGGIRQTWVEHARYLFQQYCTVHRVLSEAQFATDEGNKEKDTILLEVQRGSASESARRAMRLFQTRSSDRVGTAGTSRGKGKEKSDKTIVVEKEPVAETISRKAFAAVIAILNPSLPQEKVDKIFDDACEWSHEAVLHVLSQMWLRCAYQKPVTEDADDEIWSDDDEDSSVRKSVASSKDRHKFASKYYYVNLKLRRTQWTRPYHERTFFSSDIEIDAFVAIVLKYDIFANSLFVELVHVSPHDLWPNADLFLKQAQDAKAKAKRVADALVAQQQAQAEAEIRSRIKAAQVELEASVPSISTTSSLSAVGSFSKAKTKLKKGKKAAQARPSIAGIGKSLSGKTVGGTVPPDTTQSSRSPLSSRSGTPLGQLSARDMEADEEAMSVLRDPSGSFEENDEESEDSGGEGNVDNAEADV